MADLGQQLGSRTDAAFTAHFAGKAHNRRNFRGSKATDAGPSLVLKDPHQVRAAFDTGDQVIQPQDAYLLRFGDDADSFPCLHDRAYGRAS